MARVAQAKSSASSDWPPAPTGSRLWASNPAEMMIRSGAKASTFGIRLSKALRHTSREAPSGDTALAMLPEVGSDGWPVPGHMGHCWMEARNRPSTPSNAAWVPLPWWTSKSTTATFDSPAAWAAWAAIATLEKMQKPMGRPGSAWWPGGRTAQKARSAWPAATSRTAATTAPAARRAAFRLPADMKVSASSFSRPAPGRAAKIASR